MKIRSGDCDKQKYIFNLIPSNTALLSLVMLYTLYLPRSLAADGVF